MKWSAYTHLKHTQGVSERRVAHQEVALDFVAFEVPLQEWSPVLPDEEIENLIERTTQTMYKQVRQKS